MSVSAAFPRTADPIAEERPSATAPPLAGATATPDEAKTVVLDVRNLVTYFYTYDGVVRALEGVSFKLRRGETLGLVGETGCGKSVTMYSITRLIPDPPGRVVSGKVLFQGADLLWALGDEARYKPVKGTNRVNVRRHFRKIKAAQARMASVRGGGISMIFQEPTQAMNPIFTISDQVSEAIIEYQGADVVDDLLGATPPAPALRRMAEAVQAAVRSGNDAGATSAAAALGQSVKRAKIKNPSIQSASDAFQAAAAAKDAIAGRAAATALADAVMKGTLDIAAIRSGAEALETAVRLGDDRAARAAAKELGETVRLPSFGTQAYHLARTGGPGGRRSLADTLEKAVSRFPRSAVQRGYLRTQRALMAVDSEFRAVYLSEMRHGELERTRRQKLGLRRLRAKFRGIPYRIWGIRRRASRPLRDEAFWRAVRCLEGVQIANPVQVAKGYPFELSGGMLQRVMIAMALACEPEILMADEPTTALDVTIQAQILELMKEMRMRVGTAILLITHDLAVVAEVADRVAVMYAGQIVEMATVKELFARPLHPYTQGLLASIPRFDQPSKTLGSIPGSVPNLIHPPSGCRFHPRCPHAMPICKESRPPLTVEGEGHHAACFLYNGPPAQE